MTTLPLLFPRLSIHLADRSATPLVSSALSSPDDDHDRRRARLGALNGLTSTALAIHDTAARLDLGTPQRVLVDYGPDGPLLIQSFLDPAAIREVVAAESGRGVASFSAMAPGTPAQSETHLSIRPSLRRGLSASSILSRASSKHRQPEFSPDESARSRMLPNGLSPGRSSILGRRSHDDSEHRSSSYVKPGPSTAVDTGSDSDGRTDNDDDDDDDSPTEKDGPDSPPMLVGLVLGCGEDVADARRATVRLERVGREIQKRWTVE